MICKRDPAENTRGQPETMLTFKSNLCWWLSSATGIAADGLAMVGYGRNHNGYTEGWVANLAVSLEPAVILLPTLVFLLL